MEKLTKAKWIKCDNLACDWKLEDQAPKDWLNVLCPKCGKSIIVNDLDMESWEKVVMIQKLYKKVSKFLSFFGIKPKEKQYVVDTAPMREGKRMRFEPIDKEKK